MEEEYKIGLWLLEEQDTQKDIVLKLEQVDPDMNPPLDRPPKIRPRARLFVSPLLSLERLFLNFFTNPLINIFNFRRKIHPD